MHRATVGEVEILLVCRYWNIETASVLEHPPKKLRIRYRSSIVRDGHCPGTNHFANLGHLFALESDRHRANRIDPRETDLFGTLENE